MGPGKVLTGLMRRIDRTITVRPIGGPVDLDEVESFLEEADDA